MSSTASSGAAGAPIARPAAAHDEPSPDQLSRDELSRDELVRYSRHLALPTVGREGQLKLRRARVVLVGAGGLGSPVALYLAAAGIGHLGIVDHDRVDLSNLQRQVLHGTGDLGRRKTASARDRLYDINPNVDVERFDVALSSANALEILAGWDIVVDGTDNFPTRYLVNDACVLLGKPNVYGSIIRFEGQASVFGAPDGPCYRCLFREPPPPGLVPNCAEGGVLGVLPGLIGVIQATETIKLALGAGDTLAGRLLLVDALRMRFREIALRRDPECPACGTRELRELIDYEEFCGMKRGAASEPAAEGEAGEAAFDIEPAELAERIARGDAVELIDVREPYEWEIARIEGARHVPLSTVAGALSSLDPARDYVVYCHHGARSAAAVDFMRGRGFTRARNLEGGIARWSAEVDPSVPQY